VDGYQQIAFRDFGQTRRQRGCVAGSEILHTNAFPVVELSEGFEHGFPVRPKIAAGRAEEGGSDRRHGDGIRGPKVGASNSSPTRQARVRRPAGGLGQGKPGEQPITDWIVRHGDTGIKRASASLASARLSRLRFGR
jgi:hypothetical protein